MCCLGRSVHMHMCRIEVALQVALLHDVLDDTSMGVADLEDAFGSEVTEMVKKVSQLSSINQLLRRRKRQEVWDPTGVPSFWLQISHTYSLQRGWHPH